MAEFRRICELCAEEAAVYCPSDSAFLCTACDEKVHGANFLVARHARVRICSQRRSNMHPPAPIGVEDDDCLSSSSSSCVSSTSSSARTSGGATAVDVKVEGILVNWCRRMGVEEDSSSRVVQAVVGLLRGCLGKMTVVPFRVLLAAAFWASTCRDLRRLEQISGVPAKLIMATESRLARVMRRGKSREDHQEGSAEC